MAQLEAELPGGDHAVLWAAWFTQQSLGQDVKTAIEQALQGLGEIPVEGLLLQVAYGKASVVLAKKNTVWLRVVRIRVQGQWQRLWPDDPGGPDQQRHEFRLGR